MKFTLILSLAITATILFSCKKTGTDNTNSASDDNSCPPNMTATFNGDAFSACGSSAMFPSVGGVPATYLSISGNSRDESNKIKYSIGIKMNTGDINQISARTYVVNNGSTVPSGQTFSVSISSKIAEGSGTLYNSTSGNLIIEQVSSSHIKGKFNFMSKKAGTMGNGPDSLKIENGSFDYDIIQ